MLWGSPIRLCFCMCFRIRYRRFSVICSPIIIHLVNNFGPASSTFYFFSIGLLWTSLKIYVWYRNTSSALFRGNGPRSHLTCNNPENDCRRAPTKPHHYLSYNTFLTSPRSKVRPRTTNSNIHGFKLRPAALRASHQAASPMLRSANRKQQIQLGIAHLSLQSPNTSALCPRSKGDNPLDRLCP